MNECLGCETLKKTIAALRRELADTQRRLAETREALEEYHKIMVMLKRGFDESIQRRDYLEILKSDWKSAVDRATSLRSPATTLTAESAASETVKHRILEHGEIIQAGDEYDASARWNDDAKWKPIPEHMIGKPASDPQYPAHTLIRRMVEPVQKCDHSKLVDGEVCKCGASHRVLQQPVPQDER